MFFREKVVEEIENAKVHIVALTCEEESNRSYKEVL